MSDVYAFINRKDEVMRSSSGGAFIAICQAFEEKYGKGNVSFCGAVMSPQMEVKHICVDSFEECHVFQGSKYVRSDCNYIFPELKEKIHAGKKLLFSGTPCQVFAFQSYLNHRGIGTENVITVDVICHGTPKKAFWDDYKHWLEAKANARLVEYSFRYKPEGWKAYPGYAKFENGAELMNTPETSVYPKMHMVGYSIAKGCFSCPFSKEERVSDITLGDYWGVETVFPELPGKSGTSLILAHTEKGTRLVEELAGPGRYLLKTDDRTYLSHQRNLNRPTDQPEQYEAFWKDYQNETFDAILKKYIGYGKRYRLTYRVKKLIRKTPLIEWYRARKG